MGSWNLKIRPKAGHLALGAALAIGLLWASGTVIPNQLIRSVNNLEVWHWLETPYLYLALLLGSVSFPFMFSFHPRIGFVKNWNYFLRANLPIAAVFIAWDIYFTRIGVWGFNTSYVLEHGFLFNLPLEECLFFVLIPFACLFIYAALPDFSPKKAPPSTFNLGLAAIFLTIAVLNISKMYTATTTLLASISLIYFHYFRPEFNWRRFYVAFLISCIPFVLVNGILTGALTQSPVVMYNPAEFCGIRLRTIPLDDFAYSFLMLIWNIGLYEKYKNNGVKNNL
jgi:lycopene cyclase domain-containing protein